MITPSLVRVGAIAVVPLCLAGCTQATLGVSPEVILSTVIANLPASTTTRGGWPSPTRRRIPDSPPPSVAAARVLRTADAYVGTRYVWGGNTPSQGFDCSGFTKYVFAKYGVGLPRVARDQARSGRSIVADFRSLRPGDLMFFAESGSGISHVAIYAGDGHIIHAASSVGGVGYTDLNTGGDWFLANFVGARRVL